MADKEQHHPPAKEAPVDPEILARIDAARANPSPGIPHDEMLRDFGLLKNADD